MADDISTALADNLRQWRRARQLSQQQLADLSGVPRPTIAHLESGAANPTLAVARRVALALGASIDQLLEVHHGAIRVTRRQSLIQKAAGRCRVYELAHEEHGAFQWQRWELKRGARTELPRTKAGQRCVVCCEAGAVEIGAGNGAVTLKAGDTARLSSGDPGKVRNAMSGVTVIHTLLSPVAGA